jgi:hypothetical protein
MSSRLDVAKQLHDRSAELLEQSMPFGIRLQLERANNLALQTIRELEGTSPQQKLAMGMLGKVLLESYPGGYPVTLRSPGSLQALRKAVEAKGDAGGDSLFPFLVDEVEAAGTSDDPDAIEGLSADRILRALRAVYDQVTAVIEGVEDHFTRHGIPFDL